MANLDCTTPPPRWLRTLLWTVGLSLGTCAHIVWWTSLYQHNIEPTIAVSPSAPLEIHVHAAPQRQPVPSAPRTGSCEPRTRSHRSTRQPSAPPFGARGAIVCTPEGCTIRRSFLLKLIHKPETVHHGTRLVPSRRNGKFEGVRVFGVTPGSLADLLGFVSGDTIIALDGQPFERMEDVALRAYALTQRDGFSLTLRHGEELHTLHYSLVDDG